MQKLIQFLTRRRCKSYCQFVQKLPPPYTDGLLFFSSYKSNFMTDTVSPLCQVWAISFQPNFSYTACTSGV